MMRRWETQGQRRGRLSGWAVLPLSILLAPLVVAILVLVLVSWLALRIALLVAWGVRGRNVLFVYSNSPIWHDRIQARILPRLPPTAVVLNWSERARWPRFSLWSWAFHVYGGSREFNPLGVIVRPFGRARVFRFWRPFRELEHGRSGKLEALEEQFLDEVHAV
jgi:hypothetical protein